MPKVKMPKELKPGAVAVVREEEEDDGDLEDEELDAEFDAMSALGETLAADDLSVEDLFAGLAMAGLIACHGSSSVDRSGEAYQLAEQLCAERARRNALQHRDVDDDDKT